MTSQHDSVRASTYDLRRADGSVRSGLTPREIRTMALAGELFTDDSLSRSGQSQWRLASSLADLPVRKRESAAAAGPSATEIAHFEERIVSLESARVLAEAECGRAESACAISESAREALEADLACVASERDLLTATCEELSKERVVLRADCASLSAERDAERTEACVATAAAVEALRQLMQGQIDTLADRVTNTPDSRLRHAVEILTRERDTAAARALDAGSDREELVAALGHAQDSLRVSDDLRRALEKSAASAKTIAHEHAEEMGQLRTSTQELQSGYSAISARAEQAEAASASAALIQSEAREWVARATEQRDAAIKTRDTMIAERDGAFAERDSTRLAVGATQTDLVKARRDLDAGIAEMQSLRGALADQTSRASGLESALATGQAQAQGLAARNDELVAAGAALEGEVTRLNTILDEHSSAAEALRARINDEARALSEVSGTLDAARTENAVLQGDLAHAREAAAIVSQRASVAERDSAEERAKVVGRDELIFRESLRSEERESEIRRLVGTIAALKADLDTEHRRADDSIALSAKAQSDLAAARRSLAQQNTDMVAAHQELSGLETRERSARAALAAASGERDQISAALVTAQAETLSREQQVVAERALREQAESSSRQLLSSYERLSEETGRRIIDLEVKLAESAHHTRTVQMREEHALASLAEAHAQSNTIAQKLAQVEEQRTAVVRDRDSYAKQLKAEASARASAEDKINGANERANKAERDGRHALERAVQASMIALGGAKQRLDEDYAKSRSELETLEQLVAEATSRIIATGGTVPGLPLMPREAAIAAKAAAEAAALIAAHAAQAQATTRTPAKERREELDRPAAPPVTFRLIDTAADEVPPSRHPARAAATGVPSPARDGRTNGNDHAATPSRVSQPSAGRFGGQRERVSQPGKRTSAESDDDSSSRRVPQGPDPPWTRPSADARMDRLPARGRLDSAWLDDHDASGTPETPANSAALLALTALGAVGSASLAAIPDFVRLDLRAAFVSISAWAVGITVVVAAVQLVTLRCRPILGRRIPVLLALLCVASPLGTLALHSAPWVALMLLACAGAAPWIVAYAAWPDARQATAHSAQFDSRQTIAAAIAAALGLGITATTLFPWRVGSAPAISTVAGGAIALLGIVLAAMALSRSLRAKSPLAAWAAMMVALAGVLATIAADGLPATLDGATTAWTLMIGSAWTACAAASVASAASAARIERFIEDLSQHESPSLVAHERTHCAAVMLASAALPMIPALLAWRLVQGRSRRSESQLRSLVEFELWSLVALGVALVAGAFAPQSIGLAPLCAILLVHGVVCIGGACSIAMDRFVRFPSLHPLLARPDHGLDLPVPLVTVQRTAEHSPNRPIVHPCATPLWALADVALGVVAVGTMTHDVAWAASAGSLVGIAAWLPSFVASRTRHQDALIIGMMTTAMLVALAFAGLVLESGNSSGGSPVMAAIAGASIGMWGLILGWSIAGARRMATAAVGGLTAPCDDKGDPLAPQECPFTVRRRDEAMRRIAVGCCTLAIATAGVGGIPWKGPIVVSAVTVSGIVSLLAVASVAVALALIALDDASRLARGLRALLLGTAVIAALPVVFSATAIGVAATITAIPFSIVTAGLALIAGAVLSGLVPDATKPVTGLRRRVPQGAVQERRARHTTPKATMEAHA